MQALIVARPLLSFFVLAYAFTWAIGIPLLLSERGFVDFHVPRWLEALAAFGPALAAVVVLYQLRGGAGVRALMKSLGKWFVSPNWMLFVVFSPFVVLLLAIVLSGDFSGDLMVWQTPITSAFLLELIFIGGLVQGFGEEPGWRGFALPVLRTRYGALLATLALFPVWLVWHLPFFLSRPEFTFGAWLGFSAGILSAAVWCTVIYDATRSVLMVAIWHALINITRGVALAISTGAFLMFGQVVLGVAVVMVVWWLIKRPGPYTDGDILEE